MTNKDWGSFSQLMELVERSKKKRLSDAENGRAPALEARYFPGAGFDHELLARWGLSG
jgi:hypothetical protein